LRQIEMAPSSEIPLTLRAVIIAYRFDLGWEHKAIAKQLSIHRDVIKSLCQRTRKRSEAKEQRQNALKLCILLKYIENEPGRGRKQRAQPGSALAIAVRRGIEELPDSERPVAADQGIKKRQALGTLSPNIKRLDGKQIINIAEDPMHCEADPKQPKPLTRKRKLNKPVLNNHDKANRL
jgi:hypothetical protein